MDFRYLPSSYDLSAVCQTNNDNFKNLTRSYTQQLHDATTLSASFVMFAITAVFFILNLFSGLSDVSAIIDPKVRVGLSSALSIFLPVMSYLFSEAKNKGGANDPDSKTELPQRARFILIWMLLVELLRKKVEVIHMQGYSGTLERAGRVLWLGSLVFSNLEATGRKAMTGILWVICASKLVQRISFTEFGKHTTDELLKRCKYAVMDEDNGYRLKEDHHDAATVGKIWVLAETDPLASLDRGKRLRRMCLSFSLFKLLRQRFEHLPALTTSEAPSYRQIIFRGLHDKQHDTLTPEVLFDVTNDELNFLCEYYHSVVPVVLASPFFLLANYILLPLVLFILCFVLIVLCSNGDVPFAFSKIYSDNHLTYFGVTQMTRCLPQFFKSPIVFFLIVDFSITFLLFIMFIYEVLWEFFVFLLSDWFVVSLLCKYATNPFLMHRPSISFNQFSVLQFCGVTIPAHIPFKFPILHSISDYLTKLYDRDGNVAPNAPALGNGRSALKAPRYHDLLAFCDCESVAEVILTWHIATSILEVELPPPSGNNNNQVATSLSKYCAYLVAFQPELLPENQDSVERVFKATKLELFQLLGLCGYYFSPCRNTRYRNIKSSGKPEGTPAAEATTVVVKGATLGSILARKAGQDSAEEVWSVLADLWVELIVYIAASSNEESVGAHENVLAKGGEFITVLWAMATHAGMRRPDDTPISGGSNA
ncbi:hypothetical protein PVAP13_6NG161100 [Panicum virgatum]|uniref:DUF4220 domain-containing protein n=1 Tax=Panicum virgatum TaxID=38727 RepID=A0A8T0QX73_PANVG|nr:hypothetical protein PVAP13_6NG161100 [Panicum virgatum]